MSTTNHWGYLPKGSQIGTQSRSVPKIKVTPSESLRLIAKTGKGAKLPDKKVLRIFDQKGKARAEDVAHDERVHPTTVRAIWRKDVRKELLKNCD